MTAGPCALTSGSTFQRQIDGISLMLPRNDHYTLMKDAETRQNKGKGPFKKVGPGSPADYLIPLQTGAPIFFKKKITRAQFLWSSLTHRNNHTTV